MADSLLARAVRLYGAKEIYRRLGDSWRYNWRICGRPEQQTPPGDWSTHLYLAGRGAGKSRSLVEWIRDETDPRSITCRTRGWSRARWIIIAPTAAAMRDAVIEGESGILAKAPPWFRPIYHPSIRRLTWPNGAIATLLGAEEPDAPRNLQSDGLAGDEVAAWKYPAVLDNAILGRRLGPHPQTMLTTTPRPTPFIKKLVGAKRTVITRGRTHDNFQNLSPDFIHELEDKYLGTRLWRQEVEAELIDDLEGALWTHAMLEKNRVAGALRSAFARIVVGVDPSAGSVEGENDDQGIVVCGIGHNGHGYVLDDRTGLRTPEGWGREAVQAALDWGADAIVAESNCGGEMVQSTIEFCMRDMSRERNRRINMRVIVIHAASGKHVRAEPISAMSEQGRIHHVGTFSKMEDEMTATLANGYSGKNSPNRLDAMVHAFHELFPQASVRVISHGISESESPSVVIHGAA